jgi:hypothetical protein
MACNKHIDSGVAITQLSYIIFMSDRDKLLRVALHTGTVIHDAS